MTGKQLYNAILEALRDVHLDGWWFDSLKIMHRNGVEISVNGIYLVNVKMKRGKILAMDCETDLLGQQDIILTADSDCDWLESIYEKMQKEIREEGKL